ncbi:MAG: hypothetical protein M3N98_05095 [Actinomycetota bacterium]|nr:hypothetical protein [Actinomycetota bacterium]
MTAGFDTFTVPVEGGVLHVGRWGHGEQVVVAAHGITAYWRAHPALGADWNDHMVDAITYDLEGAAPALRSGVREAAVLADAETQFVGDLVARACDSFRQPALLIRAPAGLMGHDFPLYSDRWTAQWQRRQPGLRTVTVPAVNHSTILFTERDAAAVAALIRHELRT